MGGDARKVGVRLECNKNCCVVAVQQSTRLGAIRYYNLPKSPMGAVGSRIREFDTGMSRPNEANEVV
jgi:hypothetical protein